MFKSSKSLASSFKLSIIAFSASASVCLIKRFENFINFCSDNGIVPLDYDNKENYLIGYRRICDLDFIVLNSSWFIGKDKEEIVKIAKKIGSYDFSILPYESCNAVPIKPCTKAKIKDVKFEESKISVDGLIINAIKNAKIIK